MLSINSNKQCNHFYPGPIINHNTPSYKTHTIFNPTATSFMKKTNRLTGLLRYAYTNKKIFTLIVMVLPAFIILTVINLYTARTTAAIRAFISGEAEFSRSQKDAFLYLSNYIVMEDEHFYALFQQEIAVPKGDNMAMITYARKGPLSEIRKGFLQGRNNPQDLERITWLYKNFNGIPFMHSSIKTWEESIPFINEADSIGVIVHKKIQEKSFAANQKQALIIRINTLTTTLTLKERRFSAMLATAMRNIDDWLFWINFFSITIILGLLVGYAVVMINRLSQYSNALQANNIELTNINKDLDTFVYSASHDLRSPIASLKGLVNLSLMEEEPLTAKQYLQHMNGMIDRLDNFIKEILDFFRNRRTTITTEKISLHKLIDEALLLVSFMQHDTIEVVKDLAIDEMYTDEFRMKVVLNNLISNAYKYSDINKPAKYIKISSRRVNDQNVITIEDNGIGIKPEDLGRVFDMFYAGRKTNRDTGLGLYIVKEIAQKLNGTVTVDSEVSKGSIFTLSLPVNK